MQDLERYKKGTKAEKHNILLKWLAISFFVAMIGLVLRKFSILEGLDTLLVWLGLLVFCVLTVTGIYNSWFGSTDNN